MKGIPPLENPKAELQPAPAKIKRDMRRSVRRKKWQGFVLEARVYLFCFIGVLIDKGLDLSTGEIDLEIASWLTMGSSLVIAWFIVMLSDLSGDPAGRKKAWKRRAKTALLYGFCWQVIVERFVEGIK